MLDDYAGRLVAELLYALKGSIGIGDVVVGKGLALELHCSSDRVIAEAGLDVEGGLLMAVLAVAHCLLLDEVHAEGAGKGCWKLLLLLGVAVLGNEAAEVVSDHAVILGGVFEGGNSEIETGLIGEGSIVGVHLADDPVIVRCTDDNADIAVVLGCSADHGRAADIDVLDGLLKGAVRLCNGLGKRIEVYDNEIDRLDAVLFHNLVINAAAS